MKKIVLFLSFAVLLILVFLKTSWSAEVSLRWNPNTETDLDGYRLYQYAYSLLGDTTTTARLNPAVTITDIHNAAATTITVADLEPNIAYYFRLTAYDTSNNESGFNVDIEGQPAEVMAFPAPAAQTNEAKAPEKFLSPTLVDGKNDVANFGELAEEVTILDAKGTKIFQTTKSDRAIVWKCRDMNDKLVPAGIYIAKIRKKDGSIIYQKFMVAK